MKNTAASNLSRRTRNAIVYNAELLAITGHTLFTMLSFLRLLKQRYQLVLRQLPKSEETQRREWQYNLQTLLLAEAVQEKAHFCLTQPEHPMQIAVIGPTQAGKSSVVNWLLGNSLAEVSPLAGYTVHPQGFAVEPAAGSLLFLEEYFQDYRRCRRGQLDPAQKDCYLLEITTAEHNSPLLGSVLWDTPDFDSVDAEDYRQSVLRVAALADLVVLVVSKDKYADLTVWEMLGLLEPLAQPTLLVLNKVEPDSAPALTHSLLEKWQDLRDDPPPTFFILPYLPDAGENGLLALRHERRGFLHDLDKATGNVRRKHYEAKARAFLAAHWQAWLAPIQEEHRLLEEWRQRVDSALEASLERYQRDFLDHPQHYETFQRALAELLTLLEIPGIANTLLNARRIITWPLRQLVAAGRKMVKHRRETPLGGETAMLRQTQEHLFLRLAETLLLQRDGSPIEQAFWRKLALQLRGDRMVLGNRFEAAMNKYLKTFEPEIERTARSLYDHLREHPAILNSLRATRITTDAAALAVALHTGGLGVQDFILAPAMLSLTSLLTEGALGSYVGRAEEDLKRKQQELVRRLFEDTLREPLLRLPARLEGIPRFEIPPETLSAAKSRWGIQTVHNAGLVSPKGKGKEGANNRETQGGFSFIPGFFSRGK